MPSPTPDRHTCGECRFFFDPHSLSIPDYGCCLVSHPILPMIAHPLYLSSTLLGSLVYGYPIVRTAYPACGEFRA